MNKIPAIIEVGTRVHSILYGGRDGIVYAVHGEARPENIVSFGGGALVTGGRAEYDIVFENGSLADHLPEAIVRGVQWRVLEDKPIATAEEIEAALLFAGAERVKSETEKTMTLERREAERQRIRAEFGSWLRSVQPGEHSSAALGAKNIKKELTRAFPGVKFSVKSDTYSGGDSINIHWTAGPTQKEVEAISSKYNEGSFNGMEDIYEFNHDNVWPDIFGGARHVFANRHFPEELYEQVQRALCELQRVPYTGQYSLIFENSNRTAQEETWQLLSRTAFPQGAEFAGVEVVQWTPDMVDHHWVRIRFAGEPVNETPGAQNPECIPQSVESNFSDPAPETPVNVIPMPQPAAADKLAAARTRLSKL